MDTSDDDSGSEDEGYRRSFSHRSSSSSISPVSSSSEDEENENENDNESIVTTSTNNSRPEINQQWYKPWSWYNSNQDVLTTSTTSEPDSDATISSCEDFE